MKKKIFLIVILISIIFSQKYFAQNANWKKIDALAGKKITKLVFDKNGYLFVGADSLGFFYSLNGGVNFTLIPNPPLQGLQTGYLGSIGFSNTNRLFVSIRASNSTLWHTSDLGDQWTQATLPSGDPVENIAFDSYNRIYIGTWNGFFYTIDMGVSWIPIYLTGGRVPAVAINSADHLFAGAVDYDFYRSTNYGASWAQISHYAHPYYFVPVKIVFSKENRVFGLTTGRLHYYTANGDSEYIHWLSSMGTPSDIAVGKNGNPIIVIKNRGIIESINEGYNWHWLTTGLLDTAFRCVAVDDSGYIYAGTYNGTIYKSLFTTVDVNEKEISQPETFTLYQNYPNPFNPTTKIKFSVPAGVGTRRGVSLRVFDILGREVATLVNEEKPAGDYEVEFPNVETGHAPSLPSGIYFYQLRVGDFSTTKKMILLR